MDAIPIAAQDIATRLAIASLVGLAAGLEREWSGHASGPDARFAGLRTFCLLGLLGGIAGILAATSHTLIAAILVAGGVALSVGAYVVVVRRSSSSPDGTTEAAALTIIALGVFAGVGWTTIAAGAGAIVVLLLSEKTRLHWLVQHLGEPELRAGVQFAVLAVVVLPLLPAGPFFGELAVEPRTLWTIVLLFSGLNFAGFIARRALGAQRGLGVAGALGGVVSSTAVTLTFSRLSRTEERLGTALARGVLAACTVLLPRVLIVSAFLNPAVSLALVPMLALPLVVGLALSIIGWRSDTDAPIGEETPSNPLHLGAAIQMAVAFQIAMIVVTFARRRWGSAGVYTSATVLGLTDVDALTVSMGRPESNLAVPIAARAIAVGILSNTLLKLIVAAAVGRAGYRTRAATGLAALAASTALGLLIA
jgi:uncharacterized membrane protein (DUF4010 family)